MGNLTNDQIEAKKLQLKQLSGDVNALVSELQEAGAWPLSDDDLDNVSGCGLAKNKINSVQKKKLG